MIIYYYLAFLGIILGSLLAFFVKEELKPGQKYFTWLEKIVLIIIAITLIWFSIQASISYLIAFIAGILIAWVFKKHYFYLGLGLFGCFLIKNINVFYALVALTFVIGFPIGTLNANKFLNDKKKLIKQILIDLVLFSLPLVLLFYNKTSDFSNVLMVFSAGALLHLIFKK